ncbi:MAG TPA: RNA-binding protein [Bryobacteraceae bacterium]|jgi:RNA recognition motif-containing protein
MSFTVFLGNLPTWVTADDIKGWLSAENLVADAIKVIRNPETQESKGFAFIEAPNTEEMNSIIRRFDRAPLEDRLLRANPAQPPKPKSGGPGGRPSGPSGPGSHAGPHAGHSAGPHAGSVQGQSHTGAPTGAPNAEQRPPRRTNKKSNGGGKRPSGGPQSPFAEELAKVL